MVLRGLSASVLWDRNYEKKTEQLLQELECLFPNARTNIAQAAMEYGSNKAKFMMPVNELLAVVLYFVILIAIGFFSYKKHLSTNDFIIGSRSMSSI